MTDTTQAVVDPPKTPAEPGDTGDSARATDIDTLLAQFDQSAKDPPQSPPEPKPTPPQDLSRFKDQIKAELKAEAEQDQAVKSLSRRIRGDIPEDVLSDREVEHLLNGYAIDNEKLRNAWLNRTRNPSAWNQIEKEYSNMLHKKFGKQPDPGLTEDKMAVVASLRGASTKASAEPPPKLGAMSNGEYQKHVKDEYGFDPFA